MLGVQRAVTAGIILAEVLRGIASGMSFARAPDLISSLDVIEIVGREVAVQVARGSRTFRARGVTIRITIDTLIANRGIQNGLPLLYSDRDIDSSVAHLGLISAMRDRLSDSVGDRHTGAQGQRSGAGAIPASCESASCARP